MHHFDAHLRFEPGVFADCVNQDAGERVRHRALDRRSALSHRNCQMHERARPIFGSDKKHRYCDRARLDVSFFEHSRFENRLVDPPQCLRDIRLGQVCRVLKSQVWHIEFAQFTRSIFETLELSFTNQPFEVISLRVIEVAEIGGRLFGQRETTPLINAIDERLRTYHFTNCLFQPRHDFGRRSRGDEYTEPRKNFEAGKTLLGDGWNIGQCFQAILRRYAQRSYSAALDETECRT